MGRGGAVPLVEISGERLPCQRCSGRGNGAFDGEDAADAGGAWRTFTHTCAASVARRFTTSRKQQSVVALRGGGQQHEVPEIHHGDADGHGSDSLQQRLPPRQETAVVSTRRKRRCARSGERVFGACAERSGKGGVERVALRTRACELRGHVKLPPPRFASCARVSCEVVAEQLLAEVGCCLHL